MSENVPCKIEACSIYICKDFTLASSINFTFMSCLNITRIEISGGNGSGTIHINNESEVFNISSSTVIERQYQCATELQISFARNQTIDSITFSSVTPNMTGR